MSDKNAGDDLETEYLDEEDVGGLDDAAEAAEEGSFAEEDWESFDEDQYLGDGEGSDERTVRSKAFNNIIISCGVLAAVAVVYFTMFSKKEENISTPDVQQVSQAQQVAPDQKAEFQADTKVAAKDDFGVNYGVPVDAVAVTEEPKAPPAGLINNPEMLDDIKSQQELAYEEVIGQPAGVPQAVEEVGLPMPSPISPSGNQDDGSGLMPMPEQQSEKSDIVTPRVPGPEDVPEGVEGASDGNVRGEGETGLAAIMKQPSAEETVRQEMAAPQLEEVLERLAGIESGLADVRSRLDKIESAQVSMRTEKPASVRSDVSGERRGDGASVRRMAPPAGERPQWVLKSAQPGKAMVARKGESDMVSVNVGETLTGIGRVTQIYTRNGQWIVQGTDGRIIQ